LTTAIISGRVISNTESIGEFYVSENVQAVLINKVDKAISKLLKAVDKQDNRAELMSPVWDEVIEDEDLCKDDVVDAPPILNATAIGALICKQAVDADIPFDFFKDEMVRLITSHTANPEPLSHGLAIALYRLRHNNICLLKIIAISEFPWAEMHSRLLIRCISRPTSNSVELKRSLITEHAFLNTCIPITKQLFARLMRKYVLDYSYITARVIARYRPELLDYTDINSKMETISSINDELLSLLSHLPSCVLSEKAITNLLGITTEDSNKTNLHFLVAQSIPHHRSRTFSKLLIEKLDESSLFTMAKHITHPNVIMTADEKYELQHLLAKNDTVIVKSLIKNQYISWDTETAYNAALILANDTGPKYFDYYIEKMCKNAQGKGLQLEHNHIKQFSKGVTIIKGEMDIKDGDWDAKIKKMQKTPFLSLPVTQDKPKDSLREYIAKDIHDVLNRDFPNFKAVTKMLVSQLLMKHMTGQPLQFRPMLLLGDAGIGKTTYIEAVCNLIGLIYQRFDMASFTNSFALIGTSPGWHEARPGLIARAFLSTHKISSYTTSVGVANPVFILDEVDKIGSPNDRYPVAPTLLAMLEPLTAKDFEDAYLEGVTFDLTHSTFFMTANSIDTLSDPLLSRLLVVDVPAPTHEEKVSIARHIYSKRIADMCLQDRFSDELDPAIVDVMCKESLRTLKRDMFLAVDNALWRSTDVTNIQVTLADIHENTGKNKVGFK
jgi:ATP-dependent Lon protease